MPKSVVVDNAFDWGDDALLRRPLHETVIYEVHVKGLTMRHPDVPEALRGSTWDAVDRGLIEFTRHLIHVMRGHPVFQRRRWFKSRPPRAARP